MDVVGDFVFDDGGAAFGFVDVFVGFLDFDPRETVVGNGGVCLDSCLVIESYSI